MKKPRRPGLVEEYLVLKVIITLLPVSLLFLYMPRHKSIGLALGLSLGMCLNQIVPPRKPLWQVLCWIVIFVVVGLATAAFPQWTW